MTLLGLAFLALVALPGLALADTWRGTAPFCDGSCLAGETVIRRSDCCGSDTPGCGGCCWSGQKVLCQNPTPLCRPKQTNTQCIGIVMICDDGYYEDTGQWHSCNKYACGVCLGFANGERRPDGRPEL